MMFARPKKEVNKIGAAEIEAQRTGQPWVIRIFNVKECNSIQKQFLSLFYWGGYYKMDKIVTYFPRYLGISPFMKIFQNQNIILACIKK